MPLLQVTLKESRASHFRRLALSGLTLAVGMVLMAAGLLLSARVGTHPEGDPLIPFSPLLFIAGLLTSFVSSVIYEVVPEIKPAHNKKR